MVNSAPATLRRVTRTPTLSASNHPNGSPARSSAAVRDSDTVAWCRDQQGFEPSSLAQRDAGTPGRVSGWTGKVTSATDKFPTLAYIRQGKHRPKLPRPLLSLPKKAFVKKNPVETHRDFTRSFVSYTRCQ